MQSKAKDVATYLAELPADRVEPFTRLRTVLLENIPSGFEEVMQYGMPGFVVPHSIFPAGYHCDPKTPLPFLSFASQKNFIALYHAGLYASPKLHAWFVAEYPKHCTRKLDMGKSCIRFKKMNDIPFGLIAELLTKMTLADWVTLYEKEVAP
ncbi:MAG: DUF1801 domain-containing protein [Planctomycetes bacterium]|jgi:hypothetical protein|nr:DUF1801 domain-containing protein [Planctomycetota bacterium]MBT4028619.1 DUF1801 domain-containing protein [Planctomycetota bacterium]MBT4559511.1 DUF1801 domain-containing protein [Planctomycetota bacterium]MBT5102141.1 DUF1801 domain-containing protein [Planctomycetota bacterium]MBT5120260.1 DUF1801 domain-containing protein [Planctomycetota bacterium]